MKRAGDLARKEYAERNRVLIAMGFDSYAEYLASALWKGIRSRVLRGAKKCAGECGKRPTQVHHGSYDRDTMEGRDLRDLYPICRDCHEAIEFRDGEKMSPSQATNRLRGRVAKSSKRKRAKGRKRMLKAFSNTSEHDREMATQSFSDYQERHALWRHPRQRQKRNRK